MDDGTPATRVQDALNYRYFQNRLDDPGLLDRAVITEDGDLAVPAGGKRLGGEVGVDTKAAGSRLIRQLAARPDEFPGARLVRGEPWAVEWGPELDWYSDDAAIGRYFGYSDAAIMGYERMQAIRDLANPARARVLSQMFDFEDSCNIGRDVGGAVRLLDEAIADYYDTILRGPIRELTAEIEAVKGGAE